MRIVFFGSGRFAGPSLEALVDGGHELAGVVTQPDRARGRGRGLAPPPLKPVAESLGLRVLQPPRVKDPGVAEELRGLVPEMQVVAAYGQILPRTVIDIPSLGTINVHASLLPLYRGAAPISRAIAEGQRETGVTTMVVEESVDAGPVLLSRRLEIGPEETAAALEPRLARLGAALLLDTVTGLAEGRLRPTPQDHSRATLAPRLRKEEGRIDWSLPADVLACRIRGFHPWPGASTSFRGRTVLVRSARVDDAGPGEPGVVVTLDREGLVVACGGATRLRLLEVQPESRRPMTSSAFAAGARLSAGARFG